MSQLHMQLYLGVCMCIFPERQTAKHRRLPGPSRPQSAFCLRVNETDAPTEIRMFFRPAAAAAAPVRRSSDSEDFEFPLFRLAFLWLMTK